MRVVPYDELPERYDLERAAVQRAAFSSILDRPTVRLLRRRPSAFSEYVGLFAVDRGRVLGQTFVLRLPYRGREGPTTVSGIAMVTTRADAGRRGVALALLREAHRRETEAGTSFALLWTNRSWHAHDLYEKLGYRDVFVPPVAVRALPRGRPAARGSRLRPARPGELGRLEALHGEFVRDRRGFAPRPSGSLAGRYAAGRLSLGEILVDHRDDLPVGYVVVGHGPGHLAAGELVGPPRELRGLVPALERRTYSGFLVLKGTSVLDLAPTLRSRGYLIRRDLDWHVLMARPLGEPRDPRDLPRELAVDRPSFVSMALDAF